MRDQIRSLLEREPFLPFRLHLTGGTVYEIRNPDLVEVRESVIELRRPDVSAPGGSAWHCTLSLRHVAWVELLAADEPAIVRAPPSS
jgi:hypothetical protein